jgi:hypothetical protein
MTMIVMKRIKLIVIGQANKLVNGISGGWKGVKNRVKPYRSISSERKVKTT